MNPDATGPADECPSGIASGPQVSAARRLGRRAASSAPWRFFAVGAATIVTLGVVVVATLTTFARSRSLDLLRWSDRGLVGDLYDGLADAGVDLQLASLLVHFGMFAVLGAVICFGRVFTGRPLHARWIAGLGVALIVFATVTEVGQSWVATRGSSVADWWADVAGVVAGLTAAALASRMPGLRRG